MRKTITTLIPAFLIMILSFVGACPAAYAEGPAPASVAYTLQLKEGANFVSIHLSLEGSGPIESIFSNALADIRSIEYFDTALGKWLTFDPRFWGEQELQDLPDGSAFNIYANKDMSVTIYGRTSGFLIPVLAAGWNAVGVAKAVTVNEFAEKVADFNPVYDRIYMFNDKGERVELKLSDTMETGKGYWLDNDPDGDGVKSSVELAKYKTSPLAHDLVPDGAGQFKVKEVVATNEDSEKSDYLKRQCSLTYNTSLPKSLDELYKGCKKLVDTYGEYTESGGPVVLGGDEGDSDEKRRKSGFTVSSVRYKLGEGNKKIAGVGVITPEDIPEDLKPLFSLLSAETVFLDLKDEKALRAVGETLNGITLGGAQGLYLAGGQNETKFDSMVIDRDGSLDIGLIAKVDIIPARNYFVRWTPDKTRRDTETNEFVRTKDFIRLGMLLGDDEEPGQEVTASRVWFVKDGKAEALLSGSHAWLLDLPPGAKGVFEPYVKIGDKETIITHTISPAVDNDFSAFSWMPASPELKEGALSFTGPASKVRFLSAVTPPADAAPVENILGVSDKTVRADEKGVVSVLGTPLDYRFEKGAFVIGYSTIGLDLYFEGWKSALGTSGTLKTGLVAAWDPSFKVYLGYRSDDVLKEISAAVPLSVKAGSDIIRKGTTDFAANVKPRLLGFGWGLDGKLVLNFDGYEVGMEAGIERKEAELYKSGDDVKKLISTIVTLQLPSLKSADVDVIFNARISEQYLSREAVKLSGSPSSFSSDREGYRSSIELTGEGRYRVPAGIPLIGGSDLAAVYRGDIEYKGMDKIVARTQVSLSMAEGADTIREEDGWRFSLDELRFELEEVEIAGANSQLEAIVKYLKPTAPKGVKRFTGLMALNPPSDFVVAGPFEGSFIAERLSKPDDAEQKWRVSASADINVRIPIKGDDNYLLVRQLVGIKETGQNWDFGAVAELHLGERVIAGNLFFQKGGIFTLMVNGYDLDDTFKGVDLMVDFTKTGDKWQWSASLGGMISGKSISSLLGQDASLIKEDFDVRGTYTGDKLIVELNNLPASWNLGIPDYLILDKIKNITFVRQTMADGTIEKYFAFDIDVILPKFVDESKPKDKWPRVTLGATFSSKGLALRGSNLGTIDIGNGNSLKIMEISGSFSKDDPAANKEKRVTGKVRVATSSSWRDLLAPVLKMPEEQTLFFEYGPSGFRAGLIYDNAEKITVANGISMVAKEFIVTKQSPWAMGLRTEISAGGAKYEGTIGVQDGKARLTLPPDLAVTLPIAEGFVADLRNLNIELSGDFALAADATLFIPEANILRKIVGDKFSAKLSGSRTQYSISTKTNIYSSMDVGLLGKADYNITSLSLSSDGAFAGSGTITLKGQTTAFVIGTKAGGGLYFTADFGEKGIEAKLAQIFTLKLKKTIGLETVGLYQYLRVDDLKAGLGDTLAGADMATNKFLYFLPSSVPPVGFAFFDNLEGKAHIAGFDVNVGMSFPAPQPKDVGTVVAAIGEAFTGDKVKSLEKLEKLSAPTFGLRDVSLNFPKAPGYAWKDGKVQYTDNLFGAIFGKDKLEIVKTASLKPKDFVRVLTAQSPMDVVKVVVPEDKRKGKMDIDLRGFKTNVSYDLRADELLYEKKEVKKLPEMYKFINKLSYVDQNAGELPEELKGSGGAASQSAGVTAERAKTVEIVMPQEHGGGKAQVTWKVEDITAELKAIKDMVASITPAQNAKWQDHLPFVWDQFAQKGLTFNGNRAVFAYSPTISGELELNEYDGSLDITGIKYDNNKKLLSARFGSATLYADNNFGGKSLTVSDDVSYDVLNSVIGNDKLSSVKIEGRGKVTLFQHASFQGASTDVTGSLDSLDDSTVKNDDASSVQAYYPVSTDKVTGWRLVLKSDKGIVTTVDAGGIEVVFPGDSRVLSLLPNSRLLKAIDDTKNVLNDLKPYPMIDNNPTNFITSFWNSKVLPLKANYVSGPDDLEGTEKPVEFRKDDGSVIGFMPLKYGADKKVGGLKFDKETGLLGGKFGKVTLYEHANYAGNSLVVEDDIPDMGGTEFGNDAASSMRVEDGGIATLYSGTKYTERWYYDYSQIKAKHSGKCMDAEGYHHGANIYHGDCHNGDNQKWKLVPDGDYYQIVAKHSGKCMDAAGNQHGANIYHGDCHNGDNQKWKLVSKGDGYYQIVAKHSGKCMDAAGSQHGANIYHGDCHNGDNQRWLLDLNKTGPLTTTFEKETGWLGDHSIGSDTVRSVRVFNPLDINNVKEWKVKQSTPTGGSVILAYVKDANNQYKSVINTELKGTKRNIVSYYDENGNLIINAFAGPSESEDGPGAEFPLTNYRAYVKGTPYDLTDITEASKYIRIITKTVKFPDATTAVINEDGGISAKYNEVVLAPAEEAPSVTVFTLSGPDGMTLRFNSKKNTGLGAAVIVGTNPLAYAPLYMDDSGIPQGIKKVVGKIEGGFFLDAGLNVGTKEMVQVNLHVSGAIKTDGNYYLKGNGDLVIATYTVSEAVIELSSDKGLMIKGKMDLYGTKVDITGSLTPDNKFSFTGTAQVMVSGNGIKGALEVNNSGVNINGSVYLANKKIMNGGFAVKDGKVSWPTKVSIGSAGFDSTVAVALKDGAASYDGRAYINVDIPIKVKGPTGWKCKRKWGIKVCWPTGWGDIRVGTLSIHHNETVKGSIDGTAASIKLGIATLTVDVAKPSVKAKW